MFVVIIAIGITSPSPLIHRITEEGRNCKGRWVRVQDSSSPATASGPTLPGECAQPGESAEAWRAHRKDPIGQFPWQRLRLAPVPHRTLHHAYPARSVLPVTGTPTWALWGSESLWADPSHGPTAHRHCGRLLSPADRPRRTKKPVTVQSDTDKALIHRDYLSCGSPPRAESKVRESRLVTLRTKYRCNQAVACAGRVTGPLSRGCRCPAPAAAQGASALDQPSVRQQVSLWCAQAPN